MRIFNITLEKQNEVQFKQRPKIKMFQSYVFLVLNTHSLKKIGNSELLQIILKGFKPMCSEEFIFLDLPTMAYASAQQERIFSSSSQRSLSPRHRQERRFLGVPHCSQTILYVLFLLRNSCFNIFPSVFVNLFSVCVYICLCVSMCVSVCVFCMCTHVHMETKGSC